MKKLLIALLMLVVLCSVACAASEPGWIMAPSELNPFTPSSSNGCNTVNGDTFFRIVSTQDLTQGDNGDPYFSVTGVNLDAKYEWIKLRIKNYSDAPVFEFHFASTATNDKIVADSCTHFPISTNDEDYKEYIFNVKEYNLASQDVNDDVSLTASVWSGTVSTLRFDCMWIAEPSGQVPKGSKMDIDYIAFFDSKEAAEAYVLPEKEVVGEGDAAVEWDKNSPHFIISDEEEAGKWAASNCSATYSLGNLMVVPTNHDPQLTRVFEEEVDAEEYPFFAYRYKADTIITVGGFFFTNEYITKFADTTFSAFAISTPGEWTNLVVDMRTMSHGNWKGHINRIRLDPINSGTADTDAVILINRLGYFKTAAEALAFLKEGSSEDYSASTVMRDDLYKAIVPGGTLSEGYKKEDYILASTTPEGEGTSEPVVMYTAADGTKSVVALSYVNDYGYASYVANKAGTYTIGYNHKDYTDIAGHWGEEYINFVSDRTLFGGTSPTEFSPEDTMTRGMFITVLGRMHGLDTSKYDGNTGYTDVPATEYYAPYIQWAKAENIMAGKNDTEFAPEEPITRADMALVIKNYIDNSGFTFTVYGETEGFNDLDGLDAATVAAINEVKNVGIINGTGNGKFEPNGISTRAEVATVMQRTIKTVLGANLPVNSLTNEYITRDRIRIGVWGFNSHLGTAQGMKDLAELGVDVIFHGSAASGSTGDVVLNWADIYGIEVYMQDYYNMSPSPKDADTFIANSDPKVTSAGYGHHPSFGGHIICDEPGTDYFEALGKIVDDYEERMPGKRAYINLLPMYANAAQLKYGASAAAIEYYDADPALYKKYCQEWFNTTNTDYICTDIYPLNWVGTTKTYYNNYIESINQIAQVAREADKEFWCCIQTYGWTDSKRTPTEAEYRWQSYCMFSFGATGILLWQYYSSDADHPSLVSPDTYEPTEAYYDCQKVMWEIRELSDTFIQYKYLGTYTVKATQQWQKMTNEYTDFATIHDIESDDALLIGCFNKKEGNGTAFTIVNLADFQKGNSTTAKITLGSPTAKATVYRGGKAAETYTGTINLTLENGEGLFITVE